MAAGPIPSPNRVPPRPPKGTRWGGRQKGTLNHATVQIRAQAKLLVEDKVYVRELRKRLKAGKAPHMETLLYYYAYGKPRDKVELTTPGGTTLGYDLSKLSLPQLRALDELLTPAKVEVVTSNVVDDEEDEDG